MPTFTAITLDRLMEPGAAKPRAPVKNSPDPRLDRRNSTPNGRSDSGISAPASKLEKGINIPNSLSDCRNGTSTMTIDRKHHWTQISPALYATPEPTPLPDSPSSFPPSPYIINHKRRGPRLLKSFSQDDVAIRSRALNEKKQDENANELKKVVATSANVDCPTLRRVVESQKVDDVTSTVPSPVKEEYVNGSPQRVLGFNDVAQSMASQNSRQKSVASNLQQDSEVDDFFDPQESMSVKSNAESESNGGVERSLNVTTPVAEFYDAWEEISSESGPQPLMFDIEAELRGIRLSLLTEIEKRKQAEESLSNMQAQWQKIREQLSLVGLTLPADPVTVSEDEQLNDSSEQLSQQFYLARFVSNSIGRGIAKANAEMEMEAQMELKNFEIARLLDKLHYYEAVNHQMSQRNQETMETARRLRQIRKRRLRWIWGSIAGALSLGIAVMGWSYFPTGKGTSSPNQSHTPQEARALEQ